MNDGGSIVEFFYNIFPGILFLFLLNALGIFDITKIIPFQGGNQELLVGFAYVIIGLFLGFLFQAATMFLRQNLGWNLFVLNKITSEHPLFKKIEENFSKQKGLEKMQEMKEENVNLNIIYMMDNWLRREKATFLPTHFSSIFTFWSNIFIGVVFLSFLELFHFFIQNILECVGITTVIVTILVELGLIAAAVFSFCVAGRYLGTFYKTIITRYYMEQIKKMLSTTNAHLI